MNTKPTMFNTAATLQNYLTDVEHMCFDELCEFIYEAYNIDYNLGVRVSERMLEFL